MTDDTTPTRPVPGPTGPAPDAKPGPTPSAEAASRPTAGAGQEPRPPGGPGDRTSPTSTAGGLTHLANGRYELKEALGQGGMAEVRRGVDTRLGRQVAVKMLRADLARDPGFQARFRREAQAAAALNDPSIVAVYDTGEDVVEGVRVPFIVMEYVEGRTLRDVLRSEVRLTPGRSMEIVDGVLAALSYSHRHGIVHRDVKPGNVMITPKGEVKVMDFGIARAVADSSATMTHTSAVLGTAQYLSPEQARGETVDSRSDVYSAGCLLYELLAGRPPFTGDSPVAVAYQHVRETPPPPSQLNRDVSPAADAVTMKALAKNPENRYQTAQEMRDDIARAMSGSRVTAPAVLADQPTQTIGAPVPAAPPVPPEPPRARRRSAFVVLAVAVVAVLALLGVGTYLLLGGGTTKVAVPNVTGLKLTKAQQAITSAGLTVGTVTPQTDDLPKDTVLTQNPPEGSLLPKGDPVNLVVSSGPRQVEVPRLVGLSQQAAIAALQDQGLRLGQLIPRDSDQPAQQVLESNPPEGQLVDVNSAVDLVVSTGRVKVPDVVNRSEAEARAALTRAGFNPQVIEQEDGTVSPGTVLAQSPQAGESARIGSTVVITVAVAPPPSTPTPTPTPTTTPSGTPTATPT